jgi:USP8 interacting
MLKILLLITFCFAASSLWAQKGDVYHIVNPSEMYTDYNLGSKQIAELEKMVPAAELRDIIANSHESHYPPSINTFTGRGENRDFFQYYRLRKRGTIDNRSKFVMEVVPSENEHMPTDMRESHSFYFIIAKKAVVLGEPTAFNGSNATAFALPPAEPDLLNFTAPYEVKNASALLSTYNFEGESAAYHKQLKIEESTMQLIVQYSNESNWPSGIADFEARAENREMMRNYNLYLVGKIGAQKEFTILYCPMSQNQHLKSDMRPKTDIYFIYESDGVKAGRRQKPSEPQQALAENYTNIAENVTVLDHTVIFSTFSFDNEIHQKELGISEKRMKEIALYSNEQMWAKGIGSFEQRKKNGNLIKTYYLELVGFLENQKYAILHCAKNKNQHVAKNMRPENDQYFVFLSEGIDAETGRPKTPYDTQKTAENTMHNTATSSYTVAVTKSESVLHNFNFMKKRNIYQQELIVKTPLMQDIIMYGSEDSWPKGISTAENRKKNKDAIKKYNLEVIGFLDNEKYVVLHCPMAKNQHVKADLRPEHDIYFVFDINNVDIPDRPTKPTETPSEPAIASNTPKKTVVKAAKPAPASEEFAKEKPKEIVKPTPAPKEIAKATTPTKEAVKPAPAPKEIAKATKPTKEIAKATKPTKEIAKATKPTKEIAKATKSTKEIAKATKSTKEAAKPLPNAAPNPAPKTVDAGKTIKQPFGFVSQLDGLIIGLMDNYGELKGSKRAEKRHPKTGMTLQEFESNIKLMGAKDIYITSDWGNLQYKVFALFGEYKTQAEVESAYKKLVGKVDIAKLESCRLAKKELKNEVSVTSLWMPEAGSYDKRLGNMTLEVEMIKNGDKWQLVLRIAKLTRS